MLMDISSIKVVERIRKEINKIDELAEDIKRNGLINPVTVMETPDKGYQLLAGLRRLKAVQLLRWKKIEIYLVSPSDAEAALRIEISENEQREPFNFTEKMDFAQLLADIEKAKAHERKSLGGKGGLKEDTDPGPYLQSGESRDIIGKKIGMSGRQYDRAKYITKNASQEILDDLDSGKRLIRPTYDEMKAKEKNRKIVKEEPEKHGSSVEDVNHPVFNTDSKPEAENIPKKPRKTPTKIPENYFSEQDKAAMQRNIDFAAMPAEEKVVELQRQLKEERARAARAESELTRLKELRHNDNMHNEANINNLKMQIKVLDDALTEAEARVKEFESKQ